MAGPVGRYEPNVTKAFGSAKVSGGRGSSGYGTRAETGKGRGKLRGANVARRTGIPSISKTKKGDNLLNN